MQKQADAGWASPAGICWSVRLSVRRLDRDEDGRALAVDEQKRRLFCRPAHGRLKLLDGRHRLTVTSSMMSPAWMPASRPGRRDRPPARRGPCVSLDTPSRDASSGVNGATETPSAVRSPVPAVSSVARRPAPGVAAPRASRSRSSSAPSRKITSSALLPGAVSATRLRSVVHVVHRLAVERIR